MTDADRLRLIARRDELHLKAAQSMVSADNDNYTCNVTIREAMGTVEAINKVLTQLDAVTQELTLSNSVCACGCTDADHEGYGEDGESCEHEDHECVRTNRAVLGILKELRLRRAEAEATIQTLREALTKLEKLPNRWYAMSSADCGEEVRRTIRQYTASVSASASPAPREVPE